MCIRDRPHYTPQQYQALKAPVVDHQALKAPALTSRPDVSAAPDAERGRRAIAQYACIACHEIPGVIDRGAAVGPPLDGVGARQFLAGVLPNTPENMVRWLRSPPAVNPRTAMPELGLSERDARDIAAYLSTLR